MSIPTNRKEYLARLERLRPLMRKVGGDALRLSGEAWRGDFARERLSGRPGLGRGTGEMVRSMSYAVTAQRESSTLAVAFGVPYARAHEKGATIVPKRRQWLTVPTDEVRTKGGVLKGGARSFANLKFIKINPRLALLVVDGKKARQGLKLRPAKVSKPRGLRSLPPTARSSKSSSSKKALLGRVAFILVKQVIIPARLGFHPWWLKFWRDGKGHRILKRAQRQLAEAWRRGV